MKYTIFIITIFCTPYFLTAQTPNKETAKYIGLSIGVNGILGGIGAVYNSKNKRNKIKTFKKGFAQGALGGSFTYLAKVSTSLIHKRENLNYTWLAKFNNAIGSSIVENAMLDINFWERWHLNLGAIRLDYDVGSKKFKGRIIASSLASMIIYSTQSNLNIKKSLQTGVMYFESKNSLKSLFGEQVIGLAGPNAFGIKLDTNQSSQAYYQLIAHELTHVLQIESYVWLNPFFKNKDQKWASSNSRYRKIRKFFYFDLNGATIYGLYGLQTLRPWNCRFIEQQAEFLSNYQIVKCN